ncbi:hypothetical protein LXL04_016743 [Taraxacum kok-saghyz]
MGGPEFEPRWLRNAPGFTAPTSSTRDPSWVIDDHLDLKTSGSKSADLRSSKILESHPSYQSWGFTKSRWSGAPQQTLELLSWPVRLYRVSKAEPVQTDFDDPLYIHPSDNAVTSISSVKLTGTENYRLWRSSIIRSLTARNKLGFINGSFKKRKHGKAEESKLLKWDRANAVVSSWLLGSISESIQASHVYSEIAEDIWNELYETYNKSDGSVIFNVHQKINTLTQNGTSLSEYFNKLDSLWKEFDGLTNVTDCKCEAATQHNDHIKLMKLMQFLSGLDESYSQVKSHILLMSPLPNVKAAFSILSREESNKKMVLCYKLIGYPKDFKQKNDFNNKFVSGNQSSVTNNDKSTSVSTDSSNSECHFLTSEQYSKFLRLINEKQGLENTSVSANMAGISCNSVFKSVFKPKIDNWVVDSGANQHMTSLESQLHDVVDVSQLNLKVSHPNGSFAQINKIWNMQLSDSITLYDVFAVPDFNINLLSVHKLCRDSKCEVVFNEHNCYVQDLQSKVTVENGNQTDGLYYMKRKQSGTCVGHVNNAKCCISKFVWHNRLGHPAEQALNALKHNLKFSNDPLPPCDVCHKAKQTRESFPLSQHNAKHLGDLIHLDVWGPYRVTSIEGFKYFLTVVDDFTRATWIYLLKSKEEVYDNFVNFSNILKNQFGCNIKIVRSDNGTEFLNKKMDLFCNDNGIIHQTSCVNTPQQNGVVERKHRHILNVARSLVFQSGMPLKYWGDAVLTSVFLINRTPTSLLNGKSPFELVYQRSPNFDNLRVFGCLCFSTKLNEKDKFAARAEKCIFLGYSLEQKGYKLLSLDSNSVFVSRDVKFYESVFPFKMKQVWSDSSSDGSKDWDPFSYDEPAVSGSPINGDSSSEARASDRQSGGASVSQGQGSDTADTTPRNMSDPVQSPVPLSDWSGHDLSGIQRRKAGRRRINRYACCDGQPQREPEQVVYGQPQGEPRQRYDMGVMVKVKEHRSIDGVEPNEANYVEKKLTKVNQFVYGKICDEKKQLVEEPETIWECKTKEQRDKESNLVLVRWKHSLGTNLTWETKDEMMKRYPPYGRRFGEEKEGKKKFSCMNPFESNPRGYKEGKLVEGGSTDMHVVTVSPKGNLSKLSMVSPKGNLDKDMIWVLWSAPRGTYTPSSVALREGKAIEMVKVKEHRSIDGVEPNEANYVEKKLTKVNQFVYGKICDEKKQLVEEPETIWECKTKEQRDKESNLVLVRWKHSLGTNLTWETKDEMMKRYPPYGRRFGEEKEGKKKFSCMNPFESNPRGYKEGKLVEGGSTDMHVVTVSPKGNLSKLSMVSPKGNLDKDMIWVLWSAPRGTYTPSSVALREGKAIEMVKVKEHRSIDGVEPNAEEDFSQNIDPTSSSQSAVEPQSYKEAASNPEWIKAMNLELEALYRNNTWEITDLPKGRKPIGCRWIYKIKYKSNGEIERYKARLVAKGYNQREGIDYEETFSPVAKIVTVRIVITLAVNKKWNLYQFDINNAFLYGNLEEDVYMTLPQGYHTEGDTRVCKLLRSLYGLKQAPRKWNERLCSSLYDFGFKQSLNDYSLFVRFGNKGSVTILLVYVDDIILTGNDESEILNVKNFLKSQFLIKDLGKLKYFLGIEAIDIKDGLCLTQRKYCMELLHEFGMLGCKPVSTPLETNLVIDRVFDTNDTYLDNITDFQKLIGKLIYLTITRPDISYSVQVLSQFMHKPTKYHLNVALRLLRYLKGSPGKGIAIRKSDVLNLQGYSDGDWAKCLFTRKSVSGYLVYFGSSLISWKSKKQNTVSRSSTESEYRALGSLTCEVMWVIKVLTDLGLKNLLPVDMLCDNESAIKLALNPVFHEKTKHFEIDVHFVREKIAKGVVSLVKVESKKQNADILTKSLGTVQHCFLCDRLGLVNPFEDLSNVKFDRGC